MRRYFDNSATSFPKPPGVAEAVRHYFEQVHTSAGRGAYREAVASGVILEKCRAAVRKLFHARPEDHVIFTLNGTDALNLALKGVLRPVDHALTTCLDHNSVLRPLHALREQSNVRWSTVEVHPQTTLLDPDAVAAALRRKTRLVAINHASNVTGALQPIEAIASVCRSHHVLLLVDAAQSAGHVPIDFGSTPIDMLACPGHKGLLGPLGTGILLIRAGVEHTMRTVREGGTGSESERAIQPETLPDRFEAGSQNALGIAGLLAALDWILDQGVANLRLHELSLIERMIERLNRVAGLTWFGPREPEQRVGVFSVRIEGLNPSELSALLESEFGILTRSGLHCAPLAHKALGTLETGGTTRLSLGPFLKCADIDAVGEALDVLARSHAAQAICSSVPGA